MTEGTVDQSAAWECGVCLHRYEPDQGDPEHGIAPGTAFADLPEDWTCPDCGMPKSYYRPAPG